LIPAAFRALAKESGDRKAAILFTTDPLLGHAVSLSAMRLPPNAFASAVGSEYPTIAQRGDPIVCYQNTTIVLNQLQREAIARLWERKLGQDLQKLPQSERHRNLEPDSAEFVCALAAGCHARRLAEIGGSSGISTIALAEAARQSGGSLTSVEIEPTRQSEARETIAALGLTNWVESVLGDAKDIIPRCSELDFILLDCEKEDYIKFFQILNLAPGAVVVADNILSHGLFDYVAHVRMRSDVESITLPIGMGLEVTRFRPR